MSNSEIKTMYFLEEKDDDGNVTLDLEKRTGVLRVKPETPKNAPWERIDVSLSGLLVYRIEHERYDGLSRPQTFVGTKFCSTVNSPEFAENPFRLVKFVPKGNSDIPPNYRVELVIERFTPKESLSDVFGRKVEVIRRFRRTIPRYFTRYVEVETTAMMSSLKAPIVVSK